MAKKYRHRSEGTATLATAPAKTGTLVIANLQQRAEQARGYAAQARAERTRRTYAACWRDFAAWCSAHALIAMPCTPATLALYVTDRAERGIKPSTIQVDLSAIAAAHKAAGVARAQYPHRDPQFAEIWEGIRRTKGVAPRRVDPLEVSVLVRVVHALPVDTLGGVRDAALLMLGFAAALRRSELVALDVADITFRPDCMAVYIRKSKTDQEAQGAVIGIHYGKDPRTCPAATLRAWLAASGVKTGRIFRSVDCHGNLGGPLGPREVARIVQRRTQRAGVVGDYAGHSLRAGLATSAAKRGTDDREIMKQGRWASRVMLDRYVRDARLVSERSATADIGY
jgi:integrase